MAEKKEYKIKVQGTLVSVSEDIYLTYYRMDRRARGVEERDQRNGVVLYSDYDTDELLAVEMFADKNVLPVEDQVVKQLMSERLHNCLSLLSADEQNIIFRRYWDGKSQGELARELGTSQQAISYREKRILSKLKKLLEN